MAPFCGHDASGLRLRRARGFAFYVAHFYLIHALTLGLGAAQGFEARQFSTFFMFYPPGYGLPLAGVYGV